MYLESGDKIAVLDDVIKGVVVAVKNNKVLLRSQDNMEFWFDISELVKIETNQEELLRKTKISNHFLEHKLNEGKSSKKNVFKKEKNKGITVDLHIEKLIKSSKGIDKFDILSLQIDVAKKKLEYCIQERIRKVIFIHGVGVGVLKTELQYLLNRYPVKYYDASYQKYGLGATEVDIDQNI